VTCLSNSKSRFALGPSGGCCFLRHSFCKPRAQVYSLSSVDGPRARAAWYRFYCNSGHYEGRIEDPYNSFNVFKCSYLTAGSSGENRHGLAGQLKSNRVKICQSCQHLPRHDPEMGWGSKRVTICGNGTLRSDGFSLLQLNSCSWYTSGSLCHSFSYSLGRATSRVKDYQNLGSQVCVPTCNTSWLAHNKASYKIEGPSGNFKCAKHFACKDRRPRLTLLTLPEMKHFPALVMFALSLASFTVHLRTARVLVCAN
jgi:hypothetical protein